MFPLRDDNPTILTPVVTIVLILANIAVWVYVQGMGLSMDVLADSVCRFGAIPAEITGLTGDYDGVDLGEGIPPCVFGGMTHGAMVTSMFLHGSWVHLITNMWFLWLFGNNIEDSMGHVRFIVFYLIVGVAAAGAHVYMTQDSPIPMVGASGAISGVMGAYLLLYPRIRVETLFIFVIILRIIRVPAWLVLMLWFGLQVLSGYMDPMATGGVAVWAHVGGFVAGVLLIKLFEDRSLTAERKRQMQVSGAG
ncbi:MAG: rhomboid family intramembrane serine protease [Gemmatimonadetes bacterium]|nr:rhomboid family intramembrane serine protease [Gemmatimonadota bacterium]